MDEQFEQNLIRLPRDYPGRPELAEIRVTLPSCLMSRRDDARMDIGLQLVDRFGFHIPDARARLQLSLEGGPGEVPALVDVLPEHRGHLSVQGRVTERNKVYRVRARDLETGIEAVSNAAWLPDNPWSAEYLLCWGDLHAHRQETPGRKLTDPQAWSCGPATVDEFYQFARDVVHLDFAALTDHDYTLTTQEWRELQEGAQCYNQPGRFVTILGYEWAWNGGPDADHGHRNILFLHDDMPLVCSTWHGSNTAPDLFNTLRKLSRNGMDILSIPHHPARLANRLWYNWETTDPHFERLMEVYSMWGSSEREGEPRPIALSLQQGQFANPQADYPPFEATGHFVQDGLRMGHRFGLLGGSESHDGRAGFNVMHAHTFIRPSTFLYSGGITGAWTRRRTRDCIWSALWSRRCVATTGPRILLDVDIDNQPMGQTVCVTTPPHRLSVRVHGTGPISSVVVVKNNQDWYVVQNPGWDHISELADLTMPAGPADWYYVRVVQEDGNVAWSSPIWVQDGRQLASGSCDSSRP